MTDNQNAQEEAQDAVVAGTTALLLGAVLGGAGVVIAALAVGVDRLWNGRAKRTRGGGGWREAIANQQAWLDADRNARREWRKARRAWLRAGADPAKKPAKPAAAVRLGRSLRRNGTHAVLFVDSTVRGFGRLFRGFREGWVAAGQVRRDGGGFVDIVRARPEAPGVAGSSDVQPEPQTNTQTDPRPEAKPAGGTPVSPWAPPASPSQPLAAQPNHEHQREPAAPQQAGSAQQKEDSVTTAPAAGQAPAAPQGETNLDLTASDLENIQRELTAVNDHADQLAQRKANLEALIARASERVEATGGTSATSQALDSARAVVAQLGHSVGNVSDSATEAEDQTAAAHAGLAPARDAQDSLHTSGARGEFVAAAAE